MTDEFTPTLTQAIVRELLHYDSETGALTWLPRDRKWFRRDADWKTWNTQFSGKPAGWLGADGYFRVKIFRRDYLAHRLIWLYQTGEWPSDEMDHLNRDRAYNRWVNLREATRTENLRNTKAQNRNTSGFKGVFRCRDKWHAKIGLNGKSVYLGTFRTPEGASLMYRWAAERYYREFAGT